MKPVNTAEDGNGHGCGKRVNAAISSIRASWRVARGIGFDHFPLALASVHPLLAPLIMFRLKRRGFSNCRVVVSTRGLVVHAER